MVEIDVRYFFICLLTDIVSAFFVNVFFGLFATPTVPLLGTAVGRNVISPENLIMDLFWINVGSGFFIVLFITFFLIFDLENGKAKPPAWNRKDIPVLKHLPRNMILRGIVFSIICLLIFFPIGVLALFLLQIEALPRWNFIIMKALYGVLVSVPTAFTVRVCALGDKTDFKKKR